MSVCFTPFVISGEKKKECISRVCEEVCTWVQFFPMLLHAVLVHLQSFDNQEGKTCLSSAKLGYEAGHKFGKDTTSGTFCIWAIHPGHWMDKLKVLSDNVWKLYIWKKSKKIFYMQILLTCENSFQWFRAHSWSYLSEINKRSINRDEWQWVSREWQLV